VRRSILRWMSRPVHAHHRLDRTRPHARGYSRPAQRRPVSGECDCAFTSPAWVREMILRYLFAVVWNVRNGERGAATTARVRPNKMSRGVRIIPRYARTSVAYAGSIMNATPAARRSASDLLTPNKKHGDCETREAF